MQGLNANPFPAAKLGLLAAKVYEQCDAKDGLKDGLIDDPRRCDFKPARDLPHCAAGTDQPDCFTADQIKALDRIYGDVMSEGQALLSRLAGRRRSRRPNGQSGWIGQEINGPNGPGAWTSYGYNFLRFMLPAPKAGRSTTIRSLRSASSISTKSPPQLEEFRQILDANDPDLSAFRRHGGKLLMYFGWADPQLNPRWASSITSR